MCVAICSGLFVVQNIVIVLNACGHCASGQAPESSLGHGSNNLLLEAICACWQVVRYQGNKKDLYSGCIKFGSWTA
jgi:hypothetical protein